jgi:uncharacterized protein (DUF488 family)
MESPGGRVGKPGGRISPERGALKPTVWTIGHSTHPLPEFLDLLQHYQIELLADVRRFPGSRRYPQYAGPALSAELDSAGIAYCWIPALGGRRRPIPGSPNTGWRHEAFRGYADFLGTEEFAGGLFELMMLAEGSRTVMMCAEVLWWRCHRRLIADVLVSLGFEVIHIMGRDQTQPHRLSPPARLEHGRLSYSAASTGVDGVPSAPRPSSRPRSSVK